MQTDHERRFRFGRVIPCHVGGSVHEHRDRNELLACIERHQEHKITKLSLQMLNTEGKNEKGCAADEKRASAELARGYAEKARAAEYAKAMNEEAKTKNEEAKAKNEKAKEKVEEAKVKVEEAKVKVVEAVTKNEEAKAEVEKAKAKVGEAKAKVEEERNKRLFELLKYRDIIGMNTVRMILGNETGSMATTSDPQLRMNTLADGVPEVTSGDELV